MTGKPADISRVQMRGLGGTSRLMVCIGLLCLMNAAFWLPSLVDVVTGLFSAAPAADFANRDFANYWLSGRLAVSGDVAALAAQPAHQAALESAFGLSGMEPRSWSYPPHLLLLTWPLGLVSYPVAYAAFMAVTGGWFAWAVWVCARDLAGENRRAVFAAAMGLLAPFICLQIFAGQNGFLFGAAMLQALNWRKSRPVAAGLMFAVLTMKPQLGLLLPFFLVLERRVAVIGWTTVFTALLTGLSAWIFGLAPWTAFFETTLPYQQHVAAHWSGQFLYMMPTWFAALRATGVGHETALVVHLWLALPLVLVGLAAMTRARDDVSRSRLLLAATFVLTPYAFNYDLGALLAFAALQLAVLARTGRCGWSTALAGGLVMALPLWTPLLGRPDLLLMLPPMVLSGLLLGWAWPGLATFARPLATKAASVP